MKKFKILIADDRFSEYKEELAVFEDIDADVIIDPCQSTERTIELVKNVDALIVNLASIDESVINSMKNCKIIARYGVGYDNVDIRAATSKNIWVANVPDYCSEETSEHALALLLACVRKISFKDKMIRRGGWNLQNLQKAHRIKGSVLGIVGFGKSAKLFLKKLSGFDLAKIIVYAPLRNHEEIPEYGAVPVEFSELLNQSDFISIHATLNKETQHLFGKNEFEQMKNSVILINTSRGPIIDEEALISALKEGQIHYAGLDVFETEPLPNSSELLLLDNVILTDHNAYYSEESLAELKTKTALNVLETLKGNQPLYPVNEIGVSIAENLRTN